MCEAGTEIDANNQCTGIVVVQLLFAFTLCFQLQFAQLVKQKLRMATMHAQASSNTSTCTRCLQSLDVSVNLQNVLLEQLHARLDKLLVNVSGCTHFLTLLAVADHLLLACLCVACTNGYQTLSGQSECLPCPSFADCSSKTDFSE